MSNIKEIQDLDLLIETKKFLDSEGLGYLWAKIADNYSDNQTLLSIINAIDETKADKEEFNNLSNIIIPEQINNAINEIDNIVYTSEEEYEVSSAPLDADTLGGRLASEYVIRDELDKIAQKSRVQIITWGDDD